MSEKQKDIVKSTPDKPGFMQRVKKFFKEYRGELKKISWPTMAEVVKNTMITLAAVLMIGIVIWVFDFAVTSLRDVLITSDRPSASDVVPDDNAVEDLAASIADVVSDAEIVASIADAVAQG